MSVLQNEDCHFASAPWYAVRTKSNHERVAVAVLEGKGYESYLPLYRSRRRWSDRVVETGQPLFPGYVFCRFHPSKSLPVLQTPGVVAVLGCGREPAPIPDHEIEAIKTVIHSGYGIESYPFFREGQRIRVNRGALEGLEGILIKKKNECRMVISVTMLQRSISVEISRDWISTA